MDYKCRDCGTEINAGEYETFGVCDDCWNARLPKKEKPINSGYPLLADVLALSPERLYEIAKEHKPEIRSPSGEHFSDGYYSGFISGMEYIISKLKGQVC